MMSVLIEDHEMLRRYTKIWDKVSDSTKGCVCYIFASLFLSLNESTCQTRKNVFYFTSKALFVLKKIKF